MPESILDELELTDKYMEAAERNEKRLIAAMARGQDKLNARQAQQGVLLEEHCKTPIDQAHPPSCKDGKNCKEAEAQGLTPAQYYRLKVMEHRGKIIGGIAAIVIAMVGYLKL